MKKKVLSRRLCRINALKVLYLVEINKELDTDQSLQIVMNKVNCDRQAIEFITNLVKGTVENLSNIDNLILKHSLNWDIQRMTTIDRTIMRMATYEMIAMPETPIKVILDEAIDIAKEYSTSESGKFVNGVLDKIKEVRNVNENR